MELPQFILLKSGSDVNNKYLCYCKKKGPNHAFLRFSYEEKNNENADHLLELKKEAAEETTSEFNCLKFEVEKAKTVEGLVHIRTCYNNKYWVRKSAATNCIVAEADEPEEDRSKWSCTLFKPVFVDDLAEGDFVTRDTPRIRIQLVHISESGECYLGTSKTTRDSRDDEFMLVAGDPQSKSDSGSKSDSALVFTVMDGDVILILPEFLTFMGHNGKYAAPTTRNGVTYLEFKEDDIGGEGVATNTLQEYYQPVKYLPLRNYGSNTSWGILSTYINLFQSSTNGGYWPIKVGDQTAFQLRFNNKFLNCVSGYGMEYVLAATADTITNEALFRIGEPVRVREFTEATYNLEDSRTYNKSSIDKYVDSRSNNTSVEQTGIFQVEYKTSQTMSWSNSLTVNIGVTASWSAGIPYVGDVGVDISYNYSPSWEWGQEQTQEKTVTYTQNIDIPPGKKVTLKVTAMRAFCDVPFTCKVSDLMTDGSRREYTRTDGLYTGSNEFQFQTLINEEDL